MNCWINFINCLGEGVLVITGPNQHLLDFLKSVLVHWQTIETSQFDLV